MTLELTHYFSEKTELISSGGEDKKDVLTEVRSCLLLLDNPSLQQLARTTNLNAYFDCLTSSNEEETELASAILCILLDALPAVESLAAYGLQIQQALALPHVHVKKNLLKLLLKFVTVDCLVLISTRFPEILTQVIQCLACPDRSVAEGSVQFFKKVGQTLDGVQILFSDGFVVILKRFMTENDITRFRIYEIVVDIAVKHTEALQAGHQCGIIPSLLAELKSTDALLQLNALELLTNLTANSTGLLYLQREGVIEYLIDQIVNINNNPLSFILLPGLIEFFGNLYKIQPSVFSQQHPEVLHLLFSSYETLDPALLGVIMSTFGKIGSSDEGKRVLAAHETGVVSFFKKTSELIERKDALCVTALNTLTVLMDTRDTELMVVTKSWFEALGPPALNTITNTARLPFVEMRIAALNLLCAIATQPWGLQVILNAPGLFEFLLDRNVEFDKDCKIAKHEIIKILVGHERISQMVSTDVVLKMKQHVNEGPFFVAAELQTAFEQA